MRKTISYVCVIGLVFAFILFDILGRADSEYLELRRVATALAVGFLAALIGVWGFKPVFGLRHKKELKVTVKVFLGGAVGLLSVVVASSLAMLFLSENEMLFLLLENPYIVLSLIVGGFVAYLSLLRGWK